MGSFVKILTGILGVLAVIACLATIGVIGYTLTDAGGKNKQTADVAEEEQNQPAETPVPTIVPDIEEVTNQPVSLAGHVHDYVESVDQKATCYQAGRLKYVCEECGDYYYVDVPSTGHVADEEWEIIREASKEQDGLQVKKCIYCDTVIAQETIPYVNDADPKATPHVHEYLASTEREPTCILAGLRKYTCSCGSFYTEPISAPGHVATDWTVVEEATTTRLGREQRTCTVCGVLLDSRPVPLASASPSASAGATASASTAASPSAKASASPGTQASATPSTAPTATPTASPHVHEYVSYVLKEANCKETGIRSFVCSSCGSSYAESIDIDPNVHDYFATVIPATATSPGYTLYRCKRCNTTYMDNYTQMLGTQ